MVVDMVMHAGCDMIMYISQSGEARPWPSCRCSVVSDNRVRHVKADQDQGPRRRVLLLLGVLRSIRDREDIVRRPVVDPRVNAPIAAFGRELVPTTSPTLTLHDHRSANSVIDLHCCIYTSNSNEHRG